MNVCMLRTLQWMMQLYINFSLCIYVHVSQLKYKVNSYQVMDVMWLYERAVTKSWKLWRFIQPSIKYNTHLQKYQNYVYLPTDYDIIIMIISWPYWSPVVVLEWHYTNFVHHWYIFWPLLALCYTVRLLCLATILYILCYLLVK